MSLAGGVSGAPVRGNDRDRRTGRVYVTVVTVGWPAGRAPDPEPIMTVARSIGDVLNNHVRFEVECIDRMYPNVYVPGLQYAPGLVAYVHRQLGFPIVSTAVFSSNRHPSTRNYIGESLVAKVRKC
jgi:hypothetical protein